MNQQNKILFTDLDGVLRQTKSGKTFINNPDDQEVIPGSGLILERLSSNYDLCIGVTNQGGIPKFKTVQNCILEQEITLNLFPPLDCIIFSKGMEGECAYIIYPQKPPSAFELSFIDDGLFGDISLTTYRKPSIGMFLLAHKLFGCDWSSSMMIGDREEDKLAAKSAHLQFLPVEVFNQKA